MYVRDEYVLKYYYYLNINNIALPVWLTLFAQFWVYVR